MRGLRIMQSPTNPEARKVEKSAERVTIQTTRFGQVSIHTGRIIQFPEGILGFPEEKRFVILEHKPGSPFWWLQSVDSPDLAFVMMSPFLVKEDYLEALPPSERKLIESGNADDYVLFVFVTIPKGQVEKMTANLLGPILIDAKKKIGRQLVLANSTYTTRYPILKETS